MATKTGPIRRLIGPIKAHLIKQQDRIANFLKQDVPTDAEDLRDNIHDLCRIWESLKSAADKLQSRHDQWLEMLTEVPDEQHFYDASCDEIMGLLLESDDLCHELNDQHIRRRAKLDAMELPTPQSTPGGRGPGSNPLAMPPQPQIQASALPGVGLAQNPMLPANPLQSSALSAAGSGQNPMLPAHQHSAFKVPKINLPKFSGDVMEFKQFWGIFEANVHCRTDLSNIEKFSYLLSQLEGDARRAIAGIMISDNNYDEAVALLKSRYDRADDRLITMLYSELSRIPACGRRTSEKQRTLDDCERVFRQLNTAGEDVNSNRSLVFTLLGKFPVNMVRDLQRYYKVGPQNSLNEVREGLRKSIQEEEATSGMIEDLKGTREDARNVSNQGASRPEDFRRVQPGNSGCVQPPTSAFASVAKPTFRNGQQRAQMLQPPTTCYFCGGNHFNDKCTAYRSAKQRIARLNDLGRCPHCLKFHNGTCWLKIKCIHCRVDGQHASALCPAQHPEEFRPNPYAHVSAETNVKSVSNNNASASNKNVQSGGITALNAEVKPALFQTASTVAINPHTGQRCKVRLAMDTMSSRHYVLNNTATKLGLTGEHSEKLYVSVFGSSKTVEVPTTRVEFDVLLRDGSTLRIEANTTRIICQADAVQNAWTEKERRALDCFKGALADDPFDNDGAVDVLVGASLVWEIMEGPRISTHAPGIYLIPSKLGLMLSGESQRETDGNEPTMLCITDSPCRFPSEIGLVSSESKFKTAYPDVDEFWELEKIGITDDPVENDDDKASEKFEKTIEYDGERYQVTWPWIEEKRELLPTNYETAYDRLRSLSKRLRANPDLVQGYRDIIALQRERKIIEEVPNDEIETKNSTHYLPHHPVVKESSHTTKVRIVFDAASKRGRDALSLNECMLRGPVILPHLCHMLLRMRVYDVIVISDIEKAFLQVGLQPHERDVTRFLWFKDDTNLSLTDNLVVYRFTRVNFGIISNTFLLAGTINHHLTLEKSEFAEKLRDEVYVDNVISGLDEQSDAIQYYRQLKALFRRAGMNIQEFCSNSTRLMKAIPEADRVPQTDVKVLGLKWDSQGDDSLRLIMPQRIQSAAFKPTKRSVLQIIASVFDPMGFYLPVLLPAKCFLQRLWDLKSEWDTPLNEELENDWEALRSAVSKIFLHRITRFVGKVDSNSTIAVFCDASSRAYATAVYLRCQQPDGTFRSNLIFAKSRLAPAKRKRKDKEGNVTLPRLELLGAVIGVRAGEFCRRGLNMPNAIVDFFIDSQCVLHWINSRGLLKRFVANRVDEIRKTTKCAFHYVNTAENPADFGTRGKPPEELLQSELWWKGPIWLNAPKTEWPKSNVPPMTDETIRELKTEVQPAYFGHTLVAAENETPPPANFMGIDPVLMSTFSKLARLTAWLAKFVKLKVWRKLSTETQDSKPGVKAFFQRISDDKVVNAEEYEVIKLKLIQCSQRNQFSDVLDVLQDANSKRKPPLIIFQLGLRMHENGLIRAFGRYEHADLPEGARQPILLSRDDRVTELLATEIHGDNMHPGVAHTLCMLRQLYWIPRGRAFVRSLLHRCILCKRYKTAKPFKLPPMPPWPQERVQQSAPFSATGLDYFGPISVKTGGSQAKMWVCLFTCLSTRAVHLEPVMDCSAQEFLQCFIRFVSRRGAPDQIYSDNAAQFTLVKILGDQAWKRSPTDDSITAYAANRGISWKFIVELAPWQGGFYERLVGVVKSALRTSIRNRLLTWTDLVTLLAEAEAVVNSRPITYVSDDIDSRFRVIRPVDFLVVNSPALCDTPDGAEVGAKNFGDAGKRLVSLWKQRCRTLEKLWKYWRDEYILSLRERRTARHKAGRSDVDKSPILGEVILLTDSDLPRGRWRLARITRLIEGTDGLIRSVEIKLANGTQLRRAINHIVPLEIENQTEPDPAEAGNEAGETVEREADPAEAGNEPNDNEVDAITDQPNAQTPYGSYDDEDQDSDFLGFSQSDIQRTMQLLQRADPLGSDAEDQLA